MSDLEHAMTRSLKNRAHHAVDTVSIVASSPKVVEYVIGLTLSPCVKRTASYRQWWKKYVAAHLVVLLDGLTASEAVGTEVYLHKALKTEDGRSAFVRKYCADKDKVPRRSLGGRTPQPGDIYAVYMAWLASP